MGWILAQLFRTGDLERISDDRYLQLRLQADARRGDAAWVLPLVAGLAAGLVWLGAGYAVAGASGALSGSGSTSTSGPAVDFSRVGWVNAVVGAVAGLVVGGITREWMLSASIRSLLIRGACPYCEFSLRGLTPEFGAVRCPECGREVVLREHGIRDDDILLLPVARGRAPNPEPMGAYTGRVPTGRERRIRRAGAGIPRREPPPESHESREVI